MTSFAIKMRKIVVLGFALLALSGVFATVDVATRNEAASAATGCNSTSYVPKRSYLDVTDGRNVIGFMQGSRNYKPIVHVHVNGQYYGYFNAPLDLGPIDVGFRYERRSEYRNGKLVWVTKPVMTLTACSPWRIVR